MIDAQAVYQPFGNQLENFAVGGFKHRRALNAHTCEFVDIKEAPPVDVIGGSTPTGESVSLTFEQLVQSGKALGMA